MPLTVVLADDHRIVRQGIQAMFAAEPDFRIVGEAANGQEAVRLVERLRPDILVLDFKMPGLTGLEVAREVVKNCPRTQIVFLSMYDELPFIAEAFRAGAVGYVLKQEGAIELVKALREAGEGRRYLSPSISDDSLRTYIERAKNEAAEPNPVETLTLREREVLQMTVEGHSGTEIAARLFISPRTVESHRANLMKKLGLRNQRDLVRLAMTWKLVPEVPKIS